MTRVPVLARPCGPACRSPTSAPSRRTAFCRVGRAQGRAGRRRDNGPEVSARRVRGGQTSPRGTEIRSQLHLGCRRQISKFHDVGVPAPFPVRVADLQRPSLPNCRTISLWCEENRSDEEQTEIHAFDFLTDSAFWNTRSTTGAGHRPPTSRTQHGRWSAEASEGLSILEQAEMALWTTAKPWVSQWRRPATPPRCWLGRED